MIFLDLVFNLSLLVALSIVSGFIESRRHYPVRSRLLMQGLLFGGAAVLGMLRPLDFGPGVIFDGRSVMVSLCAMFFGPFAGVIAGLMTIACRIGLGGGGALTGVLVILSSLGIGLAAHFLIKPNLKSPTIGVLYLFGIVVHVAMLGLMFTLPADMVLTALKRIGLPVIVLYPIATVLSGKVLSDQLESGRRLTELQKSEEYLNAILQTTADGFWVIDSSGQIIEVNEAYCRLTGYSRDEILQFRISDLESIEAPADIADYMKSIITNASDVFETRHRRKDGSFLDVEVSVSFLDRDGGKFICFCRDIADRLHAQELLRLSEENHRSLIQGIPDIVMQFDREGRHLFASENVEELTGIPASAFVGRTHQELGFPEGQCRFWEEAIGKVFHTGVAFETEFAFEGKRGRIIFNWRLIPEFDASGTLRSVLSLSRDITLHRQAEQNYEILFREMMNGFALHEIICDMQNKPVDYRFLAVNPAFERMTGLKAQDIVGRTVLEIMPEIEKYWIDTYGKVATTGETAFFENYSKELDKYFEVSVFCPAPGRFATIIADITERKQAEKRQKSLSDQLLQAQKMESVGRLAGGVAHDFNNMLMAIIGNTEIALEETDPSQPVYANLQEIYTSARRSADLTRQLLAFARKQTISPKVLELNELVSGMIRMLQRLIGEDIDLVWKPAANLWPIIMDPSQIDQIMVNLAVNARDAMTGVGSLAIETGNVSFDETYCMTHAEVIPGEYVMLAVSDTGCGMDTETLGHLFEPFYTTKEVGRGTGLGLATIYGIVKQNNGFVNVYSEPGKGTVFKIYIPKTQVKGEMETRETPLKPANGTETVLLVEDEDPILKLGKAVLERFGYTVLAARTTEEAQIFAERHPGPIHLLITDVVMPQMNGKHLREKIAASRPEIRTLYMSGYTANVIAHHGVLEEGVHFLQKPFSIHTLGAKVRDVLDDRQDA